MTEGTYTYFTIQQRTVARSPWLKPEEPLIAEENEWGGTSFDCAFGFALDPHTGTGNDWHAVNKKASNQIYEVWCATGSKGWWDRKYAIEAMERLIVNDNKGKHDSLDGYGKLHQAVRHQFRVVGVTVSLKTNVLITAEPAYEKASV